MHAAHAWFAAQNRRRVELGRSRGHRCLIMRGIAVIQEALGAFRGCCRLLSFRSPGASSPRTRFRVKDRTLFVIVPENIADEEFMQLLTVASGCMYSQAHARPLR